MSRGSNLCSLSIISVGMCVWMHDSDLCETEKLSFGRSFPYTYRRSDAVRSKKRPAALSKVAPAISKKYLRLQFFLLPGLRDRTPNSAEEINLLAAGLGKRTVTLPEDDGHAEVNLYAIKKYWHLADD